MESNLFMKELIVFIHVQCVALLCIHIRSTDRLQHDCNPFTSSAPRRTNILSSSYIVFTVNPSRMNSTI
jgi:hypothetical protein